MFALQQMNDHYQLTIHMCNYDIHYGSGSFVRHYHLVRQGIPSFDIDPYTAMNSFIAHYGSTIDVFLEMVYGKAA